MSLQLGSKLLKDFGVMSDDVNFLSQLVRESMELQAQEALSKNDAREFDITKPFQVNTYRLGNLTIWLAGHKNGRVWDFLYYTVTDFS